MRRIFFIKIKHSKFYTQKELRKWINATLNVRSIPVAPGIFFVFRDESIREEYEASLYRRKTAAVHYRKSDEVFEGHKDLLQPLMGFFVERGRLPDEFELPDITQIQEAFGSVKQAFAIIKRVTGKEQWTQIEEYKSQDLLIYLALSRFSERPQLSKLPRELQLDIRSFFGTYKKACDTADKLLFSAGDMALIDEACKQATCGKLTREALYVHESALANLSPILRIYEGCARGYIGQVEAANIVKLNRHKPKVSYLSYPKFDKDPHPALAGSLVIDLRTFDVRYYDYSNSENPPILHRKEEFVSAEYPNRTKFESLTRQEEHCGLYENTHSIGTREGWNRILKEKRIHLNGHRLIRV